MFDDGCFVGTRPDLLDCVVNNSRVYVMSQIRRITFHDATSLKTGLHAAILRYLPALQRTFRAVGIFPSMPAKETRPLREPFRHQTLTSCAPNLCMRWERMR